MATQGKLNVTIGADTTPMTAGLNKAMAGVRAFLTLGALTAAARQAIAYGSAINDLAAKSQVGVKWLQSTAYAAKLAGSSMEELSNALVELRRAQAQALGGSASDLNAFAALGISLQQLQTLGPEDLFDRVADAVHRTRGGIQETNAALQVLGRGGKGLLTGMVQGFSEARQEAHRLGLVLDGETVRAMDELGDRLDTIAMKLKVVTAHLLELGFTVPKFGPSLLRVIAQSPLQSLIQYGKLGPAGLATVVATEAVTGNPEASDLVSSILKTQEDPKRPVDAQRPTLTKGKAPVGAANELARIGLYSSGAGFAGNPLVRVQNQALVELRQMRGFLSRMAARQPGETVTW